MPQESPQAWGGGARLPGPRPGCQRHRDAILQNEYQHPLSPSLQSTCDTMPNHSETISHTVNVPLQTALGTLEEIAC